MASAVDTRHSNASLPASPAKTAGSSPKPDPKLSSVAHEVAVIATGARPAESGGPRELFTEETTTVLVFENGGVLRLAAAVVPGQLLFLTNKGTKREVVAQVTRKRDFRPTSCYVEVEFSEPSPGFWGIDFPEVPQLAPANDHQREAAELVRSAKVIPGKPSASTPTAHEVTALKQEVEALREQLKLLQTQTLPANVSAPAATPDPSPSPAIAEARNEPSPPQTPAIEKAPSEPSSNLPSAASEATPSVATTAPPVSPALPIEPGGPSFSEALHAPKPVIRVNRAQPASRSAKAKETAGANPRGKVIRIALLSAALFLVATGAAWYLRWIPGPVQPKNLSASAAPIIAVHPATTPSAAPPMPTNSHSNPGITTPPSAVSSPLPPADSKVSSQTAPKADAAQVAPANEATSAKPAPPASVAAAIDPALVKNNSEVPTSSAKRSAPRPSIKTTSASATLPSQGSAGVLPPKLIKSVRAIASPNALEYFSRDNTATVTLDAVVDATGRVKSMKVLSGPASLRDSAIDALKQYRYEPATRNGKPVAAHVTVAIKFLFEP